MASKVVVHFESKGKPVRVEIDPSVVDPSLGEMKGILFIPKSEAPQFVAAHNLGEFKAGPPSSLRVIDAKDKDITTETLATGFGPGVCYMIGVSVFCW
jgi:hypothetical protein